MNEWRGRFQRRPLTYLADHQRVEDGRDLLGRLEDRVEVFAVEVGCQTEALEVEYGHLRQMTANGAARNDGMTGWQDGVVSATYSMKRLRCGMK